MKHSNKSNDDNTYFKPVVEVEAEPNELQIARAEREAKADADFMAGMDTFFDEANTKASKKDTEQTINTQVNTQALVCNSEPVKTSTEVITLVTNSMAPEPMPTLLDEPDELDEAMAYEDTDNQDTNTNTDIQGMIDNVSNQADVITTEANKHDTETVQDIVQEGIRAKAKIDLDIKSRMTAAYKRQGITKVWASEAAVTALFKATLNGMDIDEAYEYARTRAGVSLPLSAKEQILSDTSKHSRKVLLALADSDPVFKHMLKNTPLDKNLIKSSWSTKPMKTIINTMNRFHAHANEHMTMKLDIANNRKAITLLEAKVESTTGLEARIAKLEADAVKADKVRTNAIILKLHQGGKSGRDIVQALAVVGTKISRDKVRLVINNK